MIFKKLSRNTKPLCFLPDGRLVCYQYGRIIILGEEGIVLSKQLIFRSFLECVASRFPLLSRLLRLGIREAIALNNDIIVLSKKNEIYEYDLKSHKCSCVLVLSERTRPLSFSIIQDVPGFSNGVVFGEYTVNREKKEISIYLRDNDGKWEKVYVFQAGIINHIHRIVCDKWRNCLWILTGDFGEASAIWKAKDNFRTVERVVGGLQDYRGCVAFPTKEGLLYATDTPLSDNYIYLLRDDNSVERVASLPGSCIYGCSWKKDYLFSTTVEGDGRTPGKLYKFWGFHRGAGIKDDNTHLYCGNLEHGFHEIYCEKKDGFSFLFQFAVLMFPSGHNPTETLYFQPMATVKNDLRLLACKQV